MSKKKVVKKAKNPNAVLDAAALYDEKYKLLLKLAVRRPDRVKK